MGLANTNNAVLIAGTFVDASGIGNGKVLAYNLSSNTIVYQTGGGGGGTPGGSNTNVQFNDSGTFAGSGLLTFNKTTGQLSATSYAGDGSALTGVLTLVQATNSYATIASLSAYLTTSSAAGTYLTLTSATNSYATISSLGTAAFLNVGVAANNVPQLDSNGKLQSSTIPDIAIVQYLGSVASQAAMLALVGQQGDWCIRTDLGTTWVITGNNPTQLSSWTQLSYPTAPVTSVAGRTGAVTLSTSDISGISNYLLVTTASSTYLTLTSATNNYLASTTAASTYLTLASATSSYLSTATAASTYLPLTGGILTNTVTTNVPVLEQRQTWNNSGTLFSAVKVSVTNTASADGSRLQSWWADGQETAYIDVDGTFALWDFGTASFRTMIAFGGAITFDAQISSKGVFVTGSGNVVQSPTVNASGLLNTAVLNVTSTGTISGGVITPSVITSSVGASPTTTLDLGNTNSSTAGVPRVRLGNGTFTQSSGTNAIVAITPTFNQTGSAANTIILVDVTNTATGNGTQLLANLAVSGGSKFKVDTTGSGTFAGGLNVGAGVFVVNTGAFSITLGLNTQINGKLTVSASSGTAINMFSVGGTVTSTTGNNTGISVTNIYNMGGGSGNNWDINLDRTNTALGSTSNLFIRCANSGVVAASIDTTGSFTGAHFNGNGTAPTIAAGTGAGTLPTVAIAANSHDLAGIVNVTTGTAPTLSAIIATITFNRSFANTPFVTITPANAATALLTGVNMVYAVGASATTFTITAGTTALNSATAYSWNYICIGG